MDGLSEKDLRNLALFNMALEKQIPKKPERNENFYACPSCGAVRSIRRKHDYCQKCGQALDWTEESEESE